MAVVNVELPDLLFVLGLLSALVIWLLGAWNQPLRAWRYRLSLAAIAFPLSGLMGLFSTLKLCMYLFGDWFSAHPISLFLGLGYIGYGAFAFLGCWTAVSIGGRLDRRQTLSMLYNLLEDAKRPKAE